MLQSRVPLPSPGSRGRGMFGNPRYSRSAGIVATPEQQSETDRLTAMLFPNGGGGRAPESPWGMPQNGPPMLPDVMQGMPQGLPQYRPPLSFGDSAPMPVKPMAPAPRDLSAPPTGLRRAVGIFGDFASGLAGGPANFANMVEQRRREALAAQQGEQNFNRTSKLAQLARDAEANQPRYFDANGDQMRFDPVTGQTSTIYDAPTDFEQYAASLGLEPGSDGYAEALQDYVLRGSGPTASAYDLQLEGARVDGRARLEGLRQGNRLELRQTPTYRQANPAPRAPRRGRSPGRSSEPVAVNPTTGERRVLRGGQWVRAD